MSTRVRKIFPHAGPRYELFDSGALVFMVVGILYVINEPAGPSQRALSSILMVFDHPAWGIALCAIAVFAMGASYSHNRRVVSAGFTTMIVGCSFWASQFIYGWVAFGASDRAIAQALIYGWVASRLVRERARFEGQQYQRGADVT